MTSRPTLPLKSFALATSGLCLLALAIAYFFMERFLLLPPCPLCILDRLVVVFFGAGCLAIVMPALWRLPGAVWCVWAANGAALAAGFVFVLRHIWLQRRPFDESAPCLSGSDAAQGFTDLLGRAFDATADCGAVSWEFLGFTIPEQTFLLFVCLAVLHVHIGRLLWLARQEQAPK